MELILILIALLILLSPIFAIVSLAKAGGLKEEQDKQRRRLIQLEHQVAKLQSQLEPRPPAESSLQTYEVYSEEPESMTPDISDHSTVFVPQEQAVPELTTETEPEAISVEPVLMEPIEPSLWVAEEPATIPSEPAPPPKDSKIRKNLEAMVGGQIAGLIGVMILVAGIAFLVGSAGIAWPTPAVKIALGVVSGIVLLVGGYMAERNKTGKYTLLSRIMTGGGGGMFYFCTFAAYSIYSLAGAVTTAICLTLSAALLLWISMLYNSQIVSCLGVLGAFITPMLVGREFDGGTFPLIYIALINLPVMFLGVKKHWQVLYNGAYAFTLFYFFYRLLAFPTGPWMPSISASLIYFAEFSVLSLLIMRVQDQTEHPRINLFRIMLSTLFLFVSVEAQMRLADRANLLGECFIVTTILLILFSRLSWKMLPEFKKETLIFILCGQASVGLLILELMPDLWRGILWGLYGTCSMGFYLKSRSKPIHLSSLLFTALAFVYLAIQLISDNRMEWRFLNTESLALLGVAGFALVSIWMHRKIDVWGSKTSELLWSGIFIALGATLVIDLTMQETNSLPWIVAIGIFCGFYQLARRTRTNSADIQNSILATIIALAALIFAVLDGVWMGLAWSVLATASALFNRKIKATPMAYSSLILGFIGLGFLDYKAVTDQTVEWPFFNVETLFLLLSSILIALTAWIHSRLSFFASFKSHNQAGWIGALSGLVVAAGTDILGLDGKDIVPWLVTASIFIALAVQAERMQGNYSGHALYFLQGAALCVTTYLYIQFSGLLIGISWCLFSVGLSFFALRIRSKSLQNSAIAIGFAALLQISCEPTHTQTLLLINPHTLSGLFAAAVIGLQAWLYALISEERSFSTKSRTLFFSAVIAMLAVAFRNIFTIFEPSHPLPWLLSSILLLITGNLILWTLKKDGILANFGLGLIAFIPLKLLFVDTTALCLNNVDLALDKPYIWLQLVLLAQILWLSGRLKDPTHRERFGLSLQFAPIIAGVAIFTLAFWQLHTNWGRALISILWGASALAITLYGFIRNSKKHRIFALLLFGCTVLKVTLVDCAALNAGIRVAIFISVGLLLLILSFVYQKVSERIR